MKFKLLLFIGTSSNIIPKMDFSDKVVLITGASRGIGRATAIAFSQKNATVIVNYNTDKKAAEETLSQLQQGNHCIFRADVSDPEQCLNLINFIKEKYQRIDILVNNAGVYLEHKIDKVTFKDWQKIWQQTIDVNLTGVANLSFLASKKMIGRNSGKIINVSSRGAFKGEPDHPAYGAAKSGLNALTQSLAKALGKYNISVTAVAPGFVETEMAEAALKGENGETVINESPLGRIAKPEEVAHTILFLASEKSLFLTGGIIDINGASFLRM